MSKLNDAIGQDRRETAEALIALVREGSMRVADAIAYFRKEFGVGLGYVAAIGLTDLL